MPNLVKRSTFSFSLNPQALSRLCRKALLALALGAAFSGAAQAQMLPLSHTIDGRVIQYTVQPGDTLSEISSKYGEDRDVLATENGIDPKDYKKPLIIGQKLAIDNQHIVPVVNKDGIYINLAQRRLFYFQGGKLLRTYLIGVGDPDWQTPIGPFHLINHIKDKTWRVPVSIQNEMREKGQPVITSMPPGPDNPLGGYWIGTSLTNIGIHGTIDPDSIYRYESHGCMHMRHHDIMDFFNRTKVGDKGQTVYSSVMMAALPDGRIFLEAHPDAYHKDTDPYTEVRTMAEESNLTDFVDWDKVADVLAKREGFAIEVGARDNYKANLQQWLNGQDAPPPASATDPDHTSYSASAPGLQAEDRQAGRAAGLTGGLPVPAAVDGTVPLAPVTEWAPGSR